MTGVRVTLIMGARVAAATANPQPAYNNNYSGAHAGARGNNRNNGYYSYPAAGSDRGRWNIYRGRVERLKKSL